MVKFVGMTVPGHEDICKPGRPACNLSAMELSASVIVVGAASPLPKSKMLGMHPPAVDAPGTQPSGNQPAGFLGDSP